MAAGVSRLLVLGRSPRRRPVPRGTAAVPPGPASAAPAVGEGHAAAAAVTAVAAAVVSAAGARARAGGVRGPPRGAVPGLVVVARLPRLVPISRAVAMLLVSSTSSTAVLVLVMSVLAAAPAVFTGFGTAVAAQTAALSRPGLVVLGAIALGLHGTSIPVVFVTA